MNKLFSLTKVQLKDFFSKYQDSLNVKNRYLGWMLLALAFVALVSPTILISDTLYDMFLKLGHPQLSITYLYIGAVILMFLTGVPFIVSTFFYSKDLKFLASLPIAESTIIFAKLSSIYIYLLAIGGIVFAPVIVIYGLNSGFSISLILFGLIAFLLSPVLPLVISALIILPMMRLIGSNRRRNLLSVISGLFLVFLIVGFQFLMTRQETNPGQIQQFFTQPNGLLYYIGAKFPPSVWLTKMIDGSIINALLFITLNVLFVGILRMLGRTFYQRALHYFNMESSSFSGKLYYLSRNKNVQLVRRHIMIILKQPTFFLNTVLSLFVPIIMFIMMLATGELSTDMLKNPQFAPFMLVIYAGVISSPAIIANISSTAITREGKAFWETKVLPISVADNIRTRIWTTLFFNFLGSLVLGIVALFIFPVTFSNLILAALICISLTLFLATADIIVNIKRPLLNWTNPTAAVKNNMNIMISLVTRVVVGFGVYGLFKVMPDLSIRSFMIVLIGIFFVLYIVSRILVYGTFAKDFNKIAS